MVDWHSGCFIKIIKFDFLWYLSPPEFLCFFLFILILKMEKIMNILSIYFFVFIGKKVTIQLTVDLDNFWIRWFKRSNVSKLVRDINCCRFNSERIYNIGEIIKVDSDQVEVIMSITQRVRFCQKPGNFQITSMSFISFVILVCYIRLN